MNNSRGVCRQCLIALLVASLSLGVATAQDTVDEAMGELVTRLYATRSLEELYALDHDQVLSELTAQERSVFATKHWSFDTNVPVVVSIMRNVEQEVVPFWFDEAGFQKTELTVKNSENWVYEVWQKEFPAGRVELGINGFDSFTRHYFVCVGTKKPGDVLELSNFHPANQTVIEMKPGSMIYHDWTELVLADVPDSLVGQQLLTTIRGRGKEAGLVGSFRETPFPSSIAPAPVYLTWSDDPRTTQTIQWRTDDAVSDGVVRYREKGASGFSELPASFQAMEDRMLANDRHCHWFTTVARDLNPATTYEYQVGSPATGAWSELAEFTTAPDGPAAFNFFHCSDTHSNEQWGELLADAIARHPGANFCIISGDLVGTGLEREDWDMFLTYGEPMFRTRPVMPTIGNHDAQLGLGAGMYLEIFGLPENGPTEIPARAAYTFAYGNTEFFMLDVMSDTEPQRVWLEEKLKSCDATWKIAVFHFPLYSEGEGYSQLKEAWGTLFDTYHVDLVLTGHVHRYLRTYPMRAGQPVESTKDGTVYVTSVSIPGRPLRSEKPVFAAATVGGGLLCNVIGIDGNRLTFRAETLGGEIKDEFTIEK
jgi:predicted phosphodiesterase